MIAINVLMPENCHECAAMGISDIVGLQCEAYCYDGRPEDCPLIEIKEGDANV